MKIRCQATTYATGPVLECFLDFIYPCLPIPGMDNNEITAQAMLFIVSGTETTASTLSLLCYNLANYPDVQQKLWLEISDHITDKEVSSLNLYELMP